MSLQIYLKVAHEQFFEAPSSVSSVSWFSPEDTPPPSERTISQRRGFILLRLLGSSLPDQLLYRRHISPFLCLYNVLNLSPRELNVLQ